MRFLLVLALCFFGLCQAQPQGTATMFILTNGRVDPDTGLCISNSWPNAQIMNQKYIGNQLASSMVTIVGRPVPKGNSNCQQTGAQTLTCQMGGGTGLYLNLTPNSNYQVTVDNNPPVPISVSSNYQTGGACKYW